jgi:hypothetical protein
VQHDLEAHLGIAEGEEVYALTDAGVLRRPAEVCVRSRSGWAGHATPARPTATPHDRNASAVTPHDRDVSAVAPHDRNASAVMPHRDASAVTPHDRDVSTAMLHNRDATAASASVVLQHCVIGDIGNL